MPGRRVPCGRGLLAWLGTHADVNDVEPDFIAMLRGQVAGQRGFRALRKFMTERLDDE